MKYCKGAASNACTEAACTFGPSLGQLTRITDYFTGEWLYVYRDDPRCPKACTTSDEDHD